MNINKNQSHSRIQVAYCRPNLGQKPPESSEPQQQSPINLDDAVFTKSIKNSLDIGWFKTGGIQCEGEQHHDKGAVLTSQEEKPSITLDNKKFELQGFHFHNPSEHLVKNTSYPMEMHLVHQNPEDGSRAVIGVFIDGKGSSADSDNQAMKKMLSDFESKAHFEVPSKLLIPEKPKKFYRYEGSLTTPSYDENVSWVVMKEPLHLAPDTLQELSDKFGNPAREVQKLNRRFVLSTFQEG